MRTPLSITFRSVTASEPPSGVIVQMTGSPARSLMRAWNGIGGTTSSPSVTSIWPWKIRLDCVKSASNTAWNESSGSSVEWRSELIDSSASGCATNVTAVLCGRGRPSLNVSAWGRIGSNTGSPPSVPRIPAQPLLGVTQAKRIGHRHGQVGDGRGRALQRAVRRADADGDLRGPPQAGLARDLERVRQVVEGLAPRAVLVIGMLHALPVDGVAHQSAAAADVIDVAEDVAVQVRREHPRLAQAGEIEAGRLFAVTRRVQTVTHCSDSALRQSATNSFANCCPSTRSATVWLVEIAPSGTGTLNSVVLPELLGATATWTNASGASTISTLKAALGGIGARSWL